METRLCPDCNILKPTSEWSKYSNHDNWRKRCNECQAIHYAWLRAMKQTAEQNVQYAITMFTKYKRTISFISRVFHQPENIIVSCLENAGVYNLSTHKPCGRCKLIKPKCEYNSSQRKILSGWCKICINEYDVERRKIPEKAERKKLLDKQYREKNKQYVKEMMTNWYIRNKEKHNEYCMQYHYENYDRIVKPAKDKYRKENPEKIMQWNLRYRLALMDATPYWADQEEIKKICQERDRLTEETGIQHHVDHIIPLQHPLVCGLHVPWNLQILTEYANKSKSNSFIPG